VISRRGLEDVEIEISSLIDVLTRGLEMSKIKISSPLTTGVGSDRIPAYGGLT
jgi:hypothetical protein